MSDSDDWHSDRSLPNIPFETPSGDDWHSSGRSVVDEEPPSTEDDWSGDGTVATSHASRTGGSGNQLQAPVPSPAFLEDVQVRRRGRPRKRPAASDDVAAAPCNAHGADDLNTSDGHIIAPFLQVGVVSATVPKGALMRMQRSSNFNEHNPLCNTALAAWTLANQPNSKLDGPLQEFAGTHDCDRLQQGADGGPANQVLTISRL